MVEWIKLWNTHTHTHTHTQKYYSAVKKKEIMPFVTWMDLKETVLTEINQRQILHDFTYKLNLKIPNS